MRRTLLLICAVIVASACGSMPVSAQVVPAPLELDQLTGQYDLKGHLAVYEDKTTQAPLATVLSQQFRSIESGNPNFGFTRSAYWVRLVAVNPTSGPQNLVLQIANHYLDFLDVFVKSRGTEWKQFRFGARVPFDEKTYNQRVPAVPLQFAAGEEKTIFIRAQSQSPLRVPLELLPKQTYSRNEQIGYILLGLFFGALLFLIVYSLFAWSILRQPAYLYYILTIAGVGVNQLALNGIVPWPTLFSQPERMLHLLTTGIGFTCVFNILFVSSFMDARAKYPILYRVLDIFLIFGVAVVILYITRYYTGNKIAMIYGPTLGYALAIIIGLMWYWGEHHARYLFLAHIPLPIIATIHVGVMAGFIPFHPSLANLLPVAYLIQGLFFALALVDRYAIVQGRFRHMLEEQVSERSAELVQANRLLHEEVIERARTEKAIEKAKREWEQTFDAVPDLIAIIDRNHIIHRINRTMANKLGLHPRDAIGLHCHELCHGTGEMMANCPLPECLSDNEEHSAEVLEPRLGGTFIVSVTPLPTENHEPQKFVHVARDITERKLFEEQLHTLASTDSLTGIWNRRQFLDLAEREFERTRRYGSQLAFVMIDLDHFKQINDTYGHDVGDGTLKKVAEIVAGSLRKVDTFARFGGEEFVIALPETDLEQALLVAERLRRQVEETPMPSHSTQLHVTISIGVAVVNPETADLTTALKQADDALYAAKRNGRNRVEAYREVP